MKHLIFKYALNCIAVFALLISFFFVSAYTTPVYALDCDALVTEIEEPRPSQLLCPIARLLNVLLLSSGVVLTIMVIYASYKYAMAQGDPKALQSAVGTLTLAFFGFLAILFLFSLSLIIGTLLGVSNLALLTPAGVIAAIDQNIRAIFSIGSADIISNF